MKLGSSIVKDAFRDQVSTDDVLRDVFRDTGRAADNSAGSVTGAAIHKGSLCFGGQNISRGSVRNPNTSDSDRCPVSARATYI